MVTIKILDYVSQAYNGDDGQVIHDILLQNMQEHTVVTLSFDGIDSVPSSFVNSALISLLDTFSFAHIKNVLRFSSTNQQINEIIKSRFLFEVERQRKKNKQNLAQAYA